jgi:hypothetical protein
MPIPKQKEEGLCIRIPKKQELERRMRKNETKGYQAKVGQESNLTKNGIISCYVWSQCSRKET